MSSSPTAVLKLCPSRENFCTSYIKMVSFYAFLEIFIDTVTANRYERKLTLTCFEHIFFQRGHFNQKGGCPDTLDTPWIHPVWVY